MILQFEADAVEIEQTEFGVSVAGFYAEENYLMIQQSSGVFDEQDADSGMNDITSSPPINLSAVTAALKKSSFRKIRSKSI